MGRAIIGIVVGVLVANVVIIAIESVGHMVYPPPADINPRDAASFSAYLSTLPPGAFGFVVAAWIIGAGLGAWIAERLGRTATLWPGLIAGGLVLALTAWNVWTIAHPAWVVAAGVAGVVVATVLGARAGRRPAGLAPAT